MPPGPNQPLDPLSLPPPSSSSVGPPLPGQGPGMMGGGGGLPASLQIGDAMKYMDRVRDTFIDRPEVYMQFLDVMKEFQSDRYAAPPLPFLLF